MYLDRRPNDVRDLVEGEDVLLWKPRDAVCGHAIDAPEVTAVGDADPQHLHRPDRLRASVKLRSGRNDDRKTHAGNILAAESNPYRRDVPDCAPASLASKAAVFSNHCRFDRSRTLCYY